VGIVQCLISLDVVSLFTNVRKSLIKKIIADRWEEFYEKVTLPSMGISVFKKKDALWEVQRVRLKRSSHWITRFMKRCHVLISTYCTTN
ncbi:Protein of unknown function, partial [Cotesia congregata]